MKIKKILASLVAIGSVLLATAYADCKGVYQINFTNDKTEWVTVQVQDEHGNALTPVSRVLKTNDVETLCFNMNHLAYQLMQYTANGNLEYYMYRENIVTSVLASDSHFQPVK